MFSTEQMHVSCQVSVWNTEILKGVNFKELDLQKGNTDFVKKRSKK